jgi:hypothetical protein
MRLLVVCDGTRQEIVANGDKTARDIRAKVSNADGVLTLGIGPSAVVLDDEVALSEQGVADRDRLILTTSASGSALGAALCALSTSAVRIDQLAAQLAAGTPAHEEFYTRVLVELDGIEAFDRCAQSTRASERIRRSHGRLPSQVIRGRAERMPAEEKGFGAASAGGGGSGFACRLRARALKFYSDSHGASTAVRRAQGASAQRAVSSAAPAESWLLAVAWWRRRY